MRKILILYAKYGGGHSSAANAIKPLYQLIAMAQLRPDGVWDGD